MGSCVATAIRVEQMRMIRNLIEVRVTEDELTSANFKDGLKIQVKSEKPFIVSAFWIVKILDLHRELEKDWKSIVSQLTDGTFLRTSAATTSQQQQQQPKKSKSKNLKQAPDQPPPAPAALFASERKIYNQLKEQVECEIKPPCKIDTSQMTQTPRDFYPLVILVTCCDDGPNPAGSDAAANIHIVHIKDSIVPVRSHVIKQYIKQIDGRILDISQLYQEDAAACFICFEEADPVANLKLYCLLPCRHSPICSNCILRIRDCPKCRCPIASVFDINSPGVETAVPGGSGTAPSIDPSLSHLYDDADDQSTSGRREQKSGIFASLKSMFRI